ncbi:hypothetical protein V495_02195 [Pseudogymnoascus sp. VKM F-4514 (FW-929)]|nr:hypothetical protein V495_02195 [Pseudogymnoascus sp. VKM F-4514 (FW-929)]KFY57199.1 hypothetical protein V497_05707 [Pseudogymnoascus sp. VKM F-4516 (FW-969)]
MSGTAPPLPDSVRDWTPESTRSQSTTSEEVDSPRPAGDEPVDRERETLRHTISELRRSLKDLVECEMQAPINYPRRRSQFEKRNDFEKASVPADEAHFLSMEKYDLKQAMQHKISTSTLALKVLSGRSPPETETSFPTDRHPFFNLEPADLLRLTPYYLPASFGGVDPPQGWREALGVFPTGYPDDKLIKDAYQSYQEQLRMLEQQNKKRLMMAQQQHEGNFAYVGATEPLSESFQRMPEISPNFDGRSPDGFTDEPEHEPTKDFEDKPSLKRGADTQTPIGDELAISKKERHPTLLHRAKSPTE